MARLVLTAVGAYVGFLVGGPTGAQFGAALGSLAGSYVEGRNQPGPRIDDLKAGSIEYGAVIPYIEGHPRVGGAVVWSSDKIPHEQGGGGKGGPSGGGYYTYTINILFMVSANPILGIRRIWSNGKLVWTAADNATEASLAASADTDLWEDMRILTGAEDQLPDPLYEAAVGVENAIAFRGRGCVMFEGLDLGTSGYLPNLTFEVVTEGEEVVGEPLVRMQHRFAADTDVEESYFHATGERGPNLLIQGGVLTSDLGLGDTSAMSWPTDPNYQPDDNTAWTYEISYIPHNMVSQGVPVGGCTIHDIDYTFVCSNVSPGAYGQGYLSIDGGAVTLSGGPNIVPGEVAHMAISVAADGTLKFWSQGALVGTTTVDNAGGGLTGTVGVQVDRGAPDGTSQIRYARLKFTDEYQAPFAPLADLPDPDAPPVTMTATAVKLSDVVRRACLRAGLPEAYIDVEDLEDQYVDALAITRVTPARNLIEMLMSAYFFDAVEGATLKFVARGAGSAVTIPYEEMGFSEEGEVEPLPLQRLNDLELPAQVALKYANLNNDYQVETAYSDRLLTGATGVSIEELPLAFTPTAAARIADTRLMDAVASRIKVGPVQLDRRYAQLEPTDIITLVDFDGSTYRARITKVTDSGITRRFDLEFDEAVVLASEAVGDNTATGQTEVVIAGGTEYLVLDTPILRDADNDAGMYGVAGRELGRTWPGAVLFQGIADTGYQQVATFTSGAILGEAVTALADWTGGALFDEVNTVTVSVNGELQSYTRDMLLAGTAPHYVVGQELILARDATLIVPGTYRLSGLLRGRRGTEWATDTHAAGEPFARMAEAGVRRVPIESGALGTTYDYRCPRLGAAASSSELQSVTPMGVGLRPFAPVNLRAAREADGDWHLTWDRRSRLATRFTGPAGINVPLGEASEAYEVDIYDDDEIVRTISADSPEATYTLAQQIADFGSARTVVKFDVCQISAVVGRGYGSIAENSPSFPTVSRRAVFFGDPAVTVVTSYIDTRVSGAILHKNMIPPGVGTPNAFLISDADGRPYSLNTSSGGAWKVEGSSINTVIVTATGVSFKTTVGSNWQDDRGSVFVFLAGAGVFELVEWTGNGSGNRDITHAVGVAPALMMVKGDAHSTWLMYSAERGAGFSMEFPFDNGSHFVADADAFPSLSTSSVLKVGSDLNASGEAYIALVYSGDSANAESGTYVGDGTASGPTVSLGFKPALLLIRSLGTTDVHTFTTTSALDGQPETHWFLDDRGRSPAVDAIVTLTATGFEVVSADDSVNESGVTYHYWVLRP